MVDQEKTHIEYKPTDAHGDDQDIFVDGSYWGLLHRSELKSTAGNSLWYVCFSPTILSESADPADPLAPREWIEGRTIGLYLTEDMIELTVRQLVIISPK